MVTRLLTNRSEFPICSASIRHKHVFYAKLTDTDGIELPQNEEWAQSAAQKSSKIYKRPRSFLGFQVNPGDFVNWDFYLEDAYPASSLKRAEKLEISWESWYAGAETDLDGNPYRFPPDWKTSVAIPLAESGIRLMAANESGTKEAAESPVIHAEDIPMPQPEAKEERHKNDRNHLLWTILGIPLALILIAILVKRGIGKPAR
jgi:hypothetical protein